MIFDILNYIKNPIELFYFILFFIIPLLFSIMFHEIAHGYTAYKFGDMTPKLMGRLTLNPLKHLDVLGTILLLTVGLGWAKPVVINIQNIKNPTKQMLVALAGPASNIFLGILFIAIIFILEKYFYFSANATTLRILDLVVSINFGLAIFNLFPLPPLDGSRILAWILPTKLEEIYYKLEPFGIIILFIIIFTVGFGWIFVIAKNLKYFLYGLLGI